MAIIRKLAYIFYLGIIAYNVVRIHCDIWNDNDPDAMHDMSVLLFQRQLIQSTFDGGSGMTTMLPQLSTTLTPHEYIKECNDSCLVRLLENDTCIPKSEARKSAVHTIRSPSSSSQNKADALILYFRSAGNLTIQANVSDTLTPQEVDHMVDDLDDIDTRSFGTFFIMSQPTTNGDIGVLSVYNVTKQTIKNSTESRVHNSAVTAAIVFGEQSMEQISRIKVLILDEPTAYKTLNIPAGQEVVSSIIIGSVTKESHAMLNVSVHFQVLHNSQAHENGNYACAFLDNDNSKWNYSGCTITNRNDTLKRFECTCNHLTTFALIWSSNGPRSAYLDAQDITSLVFLCTSILSFIAVIVHVLNARLHQRFTSLKARDLLPLVSAATTALLFVFFIALSMTVYTRTPASSSSSSPTPCFTSARVLLFFVYFFLILMLCVKTSIGYFNYERFVHLFPEPSFRKLFLLLIISFFIAIAWTSFAAGFDRTQLRDNKLCWFTPNVNHYFLTIPVGIFLVLNFTIIILVAKRIIEHVRRATSPDQLYERRKRCVLVLLSSCVTQGVGWLFGPFISLNSSASYVLEWLFVIFNGLEGVWTILLYIIILSQHIDEPLQVSDKRERLKKTPAVPKNSGENQQPDSSKGVLEKRPRVTYRNAGKEKRGFDDLYNEESIEWRTSTCQL